MLQQQRPACFAFTPPSPPLPRTAAGRRQGHARAPPPPRITNTQKEIWDANDENRDRLKGLYEDNAEYVRVNDMPIWEPEKGPLGDRIKRTLMQEQATDEISVLETAYWFHTPPGAHRGAPRGVGAGGVWARAATLRRCSAVGRCFYGGLCDTCVSTSSNTQAACSLGAHRAAGPSLSTRPTAHPAPTHNLHTRTGGWRTNMKMYVVPEVEGEFPQPEHTGEDKDGRFPLEFMEEGLVVEGVVTDIWLYHGAQVDFLGEFDG